MVAIPAALVVVSMTSIPWMPVADCNTDCTSKPKETKSDFKVLTEYRE